MSSDKNSKDLGKFLKVLQQPIRREILRKLNDINIPFSFSALQKEVLGTNSNSVNFSFHLNSLKDLTLISSQEEGYFITNLGKKILKYLFDMEHVLNEINKPIMIRTSKYSKEKFDIKKIEEYLIQEGKLESQLAKKIAKQVQKRLNSTKINYLTAPLMREYINVILLENDLEEVRHRLTRLGTPPSEVSNYFENSKINPFNFIKILGSDVSEQYLLLNLIPKNLADLYLSGEIILLHLDYWALRPLSIYLHTETILEELYDKNFYLKTNSKKLSDLVLFVLKFMENLKVLRPYFSEDILLNEFNSKFLTYFYEYEEEKLKFLFELLISQILEYSDFYGDKRSHLSLDFSYNNNAYLQSGNVSLFQKDKLFLEKFHNADILNRYYQNPLILFDYINHFKPNNSQNNLNELISIPILKNIIFYDQKSFSLLNSANIKVKSQNFNENRIIVDKILINLYKIAQKANQNDSLFYSLIEDELKSVFELFKWKLELILKKLHNSKQWKYIIHRFLKKDIYNWKEQALKSISFIGLNEAIVHHCGIELERTEKSEHFAINFFSFLSELIREKNEDENECFILTQPHNFNLINGIKNIQIPVNYNDLSENPLEIIRSNSNLALDKKIMLFKKFEKILDGGNLFTYIPDRAEYPNKEELKNLLESNLQAFTIKY